MKVALDTNILAYAEGVNVGSRRNDVLDLVRRLPPEAVVLPVQILGVTVTNPFASTRQPLLEALMMR